MTSFGARAARPSPRLARMCAGVPCAAAAARLDSACPAACVVAWAMRPVALTRLIYRVIPSQALAICLEFVASADQAHRVHRDSRDQAGRGHCDRADRVAGAPPTRVLVTRVVPAHALPKRALLIHALPRRYLHAAGVLWDIRGADTPT